MRALLLASVALWPAAALAQGSGTPYFQSVRGDVTAATVTGTPLSTIKAQAGGAVQKTNNLSDVASASAALVNLGALGSAQLGAASGVAQLDANKLLLGAQIPFGAVSGKVADGGTLATVQGTANGAVPKSGLVDPRSNIVVPQATADRQRPVAVGQFKLVTDIDDTSSFQNAINIAGILHADIYAPGGDYYIGGNCQRIDFPVVNTAEKFFGDGMGQTILHADTTACSANGNSSPEIFRLYNGSSLGPHANYFTMRDLSILGNFMEGKAAANGNAAVAGFAASTRIGFALFGMTSAAFDHVELGDLPYFGISATLSNLVWVSNSWFHHIARDSVSIQDTTSLISAYNRFEHTGDDAISPHANNGSEAITGHVRRYITSVGDVMTDVGGCIDAIGVLHLQVAGLTCDRPHNFGITSSYNSGSTIGPSYISITGSSIINMMNAGYVAGDTGQFATSAIRIDSLVSKGGAGGTTLNQPPMINDPSVANAAIASQYAYTYLSAGQNAAMPQPNAGTFGLHIANNTFGRTLPLGGTYSSFGFDQYFSRNGWLNPTITAQNMGLSTAVTLTGNFYDLDISGNVMRGLYDCFSLGQAQSALSLMTMVGKVHDNQCSDFTHAGVDFVGAAAIAPEFYHNTFDGDPLRAHPNRAAVGSAAWLQNAASGQVVSPVVIGSSYAAPTLVMSDTARNVMAINDSGSAPAAGSIDGRMTLEAEPVTVGSWAAANLGIGLAPVASDLFHYRVIDENVASATYGQILNTEPGSAPAVPTSGYWIAGTFVRDSGITAAGDNQATGWFRVTTGSGNVLGTDWIALGQTAKAVLANSVTAGPSTLSSNGTIGTVSVTAPGYYYNDTAATVPITLTVPAPPAGGTQATAHVSSLIGIANSGVTTPGSGYVSGTGYPIKDSTGAYTIGTLTPTASGPLSNGNYSIVYLPLSLAFMPQGPFNIGTGGGQITFFNFNVTGVAIDNPGAGYATNQTITGSSNHNGGLPMTATGVLGGAASLGPTTAQSLTVGAGGFIAPGAVLGGDVNLASNKSVYFQDATTGKRCYFNMNSSGVMGCFTTNSNNGGSTLDNWAFGQVTLAGLLGLGGLPVASLPTGCTPDQVLYATDGRKSGEAAGAGSGVPVVCTAATKGGATAWYAMAISPVAN